MMLTKTIVASKDQISTDLQGEAVILNLKSGVYYGLNPLGARIWQLIQQPAAVQAIFDTLLAEYDVEPQRLQADLDKLLGSMEAKGLIEVVDEAGA